MQNCRTPNQGRERLHRLRQRHEGLKGMPLDVDIWILSGFWEFQIELVAFFGFGLRIQDLGSGAAKFGLLGT